MPTLARYGILSASESSNEKEVCPVCRGDYKRCRLEICPYLRGVRELLRRVQSSKTVFGSSPPSALIGSWGYPKVLAGPLVPPIQADTSLFDQPGKWLTIPLNDLLAMRVSLIRGKRPVRVVDARRPDRVLESMQEIAMAERPLDVELEFEKEPVISPSFHVRASPTGPSAPMRKALIAENPRVPKPVEKVVSDVDLRASEAIYQLYQSGLSDQYIVRLLSLGLLGQKRWRKLVPTEWGITAVDDQIGRRLRSRVKRYPWINDLRIYTGFAHFNRVTGFLLPGPWMFEVFEVWHKRAGMKIYHDSELPGDVYRYPENVGGAYHALRLPVLEHLSKQQKQASVIVIAEIYEGWIPLGVWRFREVCRKAFKNSPYRFNDFNEAVQALRRAIDFPAKIVLQQSRVIDFYLRQKKLSSFIDLPFQEIL